MKILIIGGGGSIAKKHIENLVELGINDIDICDPRVEFAKYKDIEEVGNNEERYDLAIIATPPATHLELLHKLNVRGFKYIMIEKPLFSMPTDYQIMMEMGRPPQFRPLNCHVFVNNAYRFENGYRKLKELLPKCGKIKYVNMENAYSFKKLHPQYKWEDYEGIIYDDSHIINTSRYLFGEPKEIKFKYIKKDIAMFLWETESGHVVFHNTNILNEVYKKRVEVVGELGNLVYNYAAHHIYWCPADESTRIAIAYDHQSHLFEAMKYVISIVKNQGEFGENQIWDAYKDMEIIKELIV